MHVNIAIVIRILGRNVFHWCIGEIDHILLMRAFSKCSGNRVLPSGRATNPADQIILLLKDSAGQRRRMVTRVEWDLAAMDD